MKTLLLTLAAPLIGGGNILIGNKKDDNAFFRKDYTTVLKGLCCLIVIYVHIPMDHRNPLQDAIGSFAYVCVTIFFLISAYGMMLSVEKNQDYIKTFWRNRLVALFIPCLFVNIVAFALGFASTSEMNYRLLYDVNHYVIILLEWCVWFYIVQACKRKWFPEKKGAGDLLLISGTLLSSLYMYLGVDAVVSAEAGWPFERMGLVWGVILYRYFGRIKAWMDKHRLVKTILMAVLGGVLGIAYLKYKTVFFWGEYLLKVVLGAVLIATLFLATSTRYFGNKFGLWLGDVSYEVYLLHHAVMSFLLLGFGTALDSGEFIVLTVIITVVLSGLIHRVDSRVVKWLRV